MTEVPQITTDRLLLRAWIPSDHEPFATLNADAGVMRYLGGPLTREQSDAFIGRIMTGFAEHGFGLWAVETGSDGRFIGYVGLSVPRFQAHFTPCVEIGWRLAAASWGHGYATEAARAVLAFGFEQRELPEIVSFTTVANDRSRRVMERLGMRRLPGDDFGHPALPPDHPLRPHVLYRLTRVEWLARRALEQNPVLFA